MNIYFRLGVVCLLLLSCKHEQDHLKDSLVIGLSSKVKYIEISENDSLKTIINLQNNKIESIVKYVNNKIDGEQLSFYSNGILWKKMDVSNGMHDKNLYEFYNSGSILSYTYYCKIYPCYFGVEYWDNPLNTIKKSIHYGEKGKINKVRLFNSLGNFIKDSIPQ